MKALVVTGATGYIGRRLVRAAVAKGWDVVAASRTEGAQSGARWLRYRLEGDFATSAIPAGAVIVHLAADTSSGKEATVEREMASARRLLDAAAVQKARVVFVSSQAARHDAPTAYGRAKWNVEELILKAGGTVVRPGLVYGGPPGGLFRQLLSQVRDALALPALLPAPRVQPIHVDDLVAGLLTIAERDDLTATALNLAAPEPVSFTVFLRTIALARVRRRRLFVPLPVALLGPVVRAANAVLGRAIDPGRVRSLVDLPAMASAADVARLDLRLRPLAAGMHPSGDDRRRRLLSEGGALIGYILGERAPSSLMRRYVRAIEGLHNGTPTAVSAWLLDRPRCIAALDRAALSSSAECVEWQWRLDMATLLAEASPQGARQFLMIGQTAGIVGATISLAQVAVSEVFRRLASLLAAPLLRRALVRRDGER